MVKGGGETDMESGGKCSSNGQLYPGMMESPELRWAFIRKVYAILAFQLLLTVSVAAVFVFVKPIPDFLNYSGTAGAVVLIVIFILPFILLGPLYAFRQHHPVNLILLMIFTIAISCSLGVTCIVRKGEIILETTVLTIVVVVSLTVYTFWAVRRGKDFGFLGPFLFASLLVLLVFALIQILFPLGKLSHMIYSCLATIIFSGYIVYDTNNLIKRFNHDQYVMAAIALYLDVVNLFYSLLMGRVPS